MSKYQQEMLSINLGKRIGIPSVAMRYSIVQGSRQSFYNAYSGACRIFSLAYFFDKSPTIYEDGNSIRDFINIKDVVNANILVMESNDANNKVFNVGGGKKYSVLEFAKIASEVFNVEFKYDLPNEYRYGDTRHIFSDISKLKSLGWAPKFSPKDSLEEYKKYLECQEDIEYILEYAAKNMKNLGVVRKVSQK